MCRELCDMQINDSIKVFPPTYLLTTKEKTVTLLWRNPVETHLKQVIKVNQHYQQ